MPGSKANIVRFVFVEPPETMARRPDPIVGVELMGLPGETDWKTWSSAISNMLRFDFIMVGEHSYPLSVGDANCTGVFFVVFWSGAFTTMLDSAGTRML